MNKLFTKGDQLLKHPARVFLNQNISIIKFEIFHLLVFCLEILLGLIGKKNLKRPSGASWHLPGIFRISAPVTTQYNVNVREPLLSPAETWQRAGASALAPPAKGQAARLS